MWCKNCERESFDEICEVCGGITEVDIPVAVYWCDTCKAPIIHKVTDKNKDICPVCKSTTAYMCSDLRPVFIV